jgi:hypothetical protein
MNAIRILSLVFSFCLTSSVFPQGSLTPPAAPAPTMKTLDQIEPRTRIPGGTSGFTITASGSYYLSGNLSIASGDAVTINASNVTLDLGGFEVASTGGARGRGYRQHPVQYNDPTWDGSQLRRPGN